MFNKHLICANEFHRDLSQLFTFMIQNFFFKNKKFYQYYFLKEFVPDKKATFKVGEIWVREYDIYSVHFYCLLQNLPTKYSCQQHFSRTSTIWFLLMLLICFIHTIEYKPEKHHCNSVLWSILGLLFSKISYSRPSSPKMTECWFQYGRYNKILP